MQAKKELRGRSAVPHPKQPGYDVGRHARTAHEQLQRRATGVSNSHPFQVLDGGAGAVPAAGSSAPTTEPAAAGVPVSGAAGSGGFVD
jgi:hypothetical protein